MSSWVEKLKNEFTITCGDNVTYTFLWRNASLGLEWNVAEFMFPNIEGTLVKKSKMMGRKINLDIYLSGENHLDVAENFLDSLKNENPCKITHPYYGLLLVQIATLNVNNEQHNVTNFTGTAIETITEDAPKTTAEPIDQIPLQKLATDNDFEVTLTGLVLPNDINNITSATNKSLKVGVPIIKIPTEFETYFNLFNVANSYVSTALSAPILAMRAITAFINYPALFTASVKDRLNCLQQQFNIVRSYLPLTIKPASKQIYQIQSAAHISSMCIASSTPLITDFKNSVDVLSTIDVIVNNYNQYLIDLDTLQTLNGGSVNSFIPDAQALISLNQLVNLTVSNLFDIALNSKKQFSIILENDTNIILLTHRFYGLDPNDANIKEMIQNNNFGLNNLLQIEKGTKITYYI